MENKENPEKYFIQKKNAAKIANRWVPAKNK